MVSIIYELAISSTTHSYKKKMMDYVVIWCGVLELSLNQNPISIFAFLFLFYIYSRQKANSPFDLTNGCSFRSAAGGKSNTVQYILWRNIALWCTQFHLNGTMPNKKNCLLNRFLPCFCNNECLYTCNVMLWWKLYQLLIPFS